MDFLEFGDPNGRPVIYFCANFGMCRWPADGEFTAGQTGLRVIVPIRPGYGGSTPLPLGIDRAQAVAEDVIALMDRLDIPAAHCLVLDEDMPFAARLHAIAPDRVLGVLGCGASLPFLRDAQYQRMGAGTGSCWALRGLRRSSCPLPRARALPWRGSWARPNSCG